MFWRGRILAEFLLSGACLALCAATIIYPQWIELIFGADPDGGSGDAEWGIVVALAATCLVFLLLGRFEMKRARRLGLIAN